MHTGFIKHHIDQNRVNEFIKFTRRYLKKMNIRLEFRRGATVRTIDGERAEAFFCEPSRSEQGVVVIAKGIPQREWLINLGHELGHVAQWLTEDQVWDVGGLNAEIKAEKYSLKMMQFFGLPIDEKWQKKMSKKYIKMVTEDGYEDGER